MTREPDIEALVRSALGAHVDDPHRPADDLAERVVQRGTVVRRRRRVGAVAAGVATSLAVVGGMWGVFGTHRHEPQPTMPAATTVDPRSPGAVVPRVETSSSGQVLRLADRTVALPATPVTAVRAAGPSAVVLASDAGGQTLSVVEPEGRVRALASGVVAAFAVSPDATSVAYVGGPAGSDALTLKVRTLGTGEVTASADGTAFTGVRSIVWSGADVFVTHSSGPLTRWRPGTPPATVAAGLAAYSSHLATHARGTQQCLRAIAGGADIVCASSVEAAESPDGKVALVRAVGPEGRFLYRVTPATGARAQMLLAPDLAAADWSRVAWTRSGTPVVPVPPGWRSVDLSTGAATSQSLPAGVTRIVG